MLSRVFAPFVLWVLLSLVLLSSPAPASAAVCGGAGFDLSSITFSDLVYNDTTTYMWYFHPCGNVTYSGCQQLETSTSGGVMLCQLPFWGPPGYPIATWVPEYTQSLTTWTPYGGNQGNRGVRMQLQDGGGCGAAGNRILTVNFQCSPQQPAGIAQFTFINETSLCNYVATVLTSATCNGPNATTNGQVACGTTGLNLAPLTTTDMIYKDTARNYTYYFRPCGVVSSAQCANNPYGNVAGEAMMCQAAGLNNELSPYTYDLAWWNPQLATWRRWEYNGYNGWWMSIQDGTTCAGAGNGISRSLTVVYACVTTATTPIFALLNETSTCNYQAIIYTSLACNNSQISTTTTPCGGPYDLSFATQRDLIYQPAGTTMYLVFRPCGIVDNAVCQSNANTNSSMLCQAYQGSSVTNDIAIYKPASVTYQPTLTGIQMYIADGDTCGPYGPRSLTVNFVCQQGGGPNSINFVGWSENPTCTYFATVTTPAVCRSGRQNGICGSGNYDFSLSGTSEYAYSTANGQYTYYFQPCGQVLNAQCNANNATASSMMCQAVNGQTTTYDIAFYDANLVSWYRLTNGWQMFVQDGASCGGNGYERALTVNFICGSSPVFMNMTEVTTCNYVAFVMTPQACNTIGTGGTGISFAGPSTGAGAPAYETITKCGGIYNLLPLSTTDLTYSDWQYNWVFRPCGALNTNSNCTAAAASTTGGWMVCQDSKLGYGDYEGSSYNQNTVSWTPTRNPPGVLMVQADGTQCGSLGPRVTRAFFICNATATTAVMFNVTEGPTCTYNMYVWTILACPSAATYCGGGGYDITALTARSDLSYTNTAAGYTFYFSPCGTVQSSQCQANVLTQSAMACQASITSNSSYNLAVYAPQVTTWTPLTNGYSGVQMLVQDGSTCDNYDFERVFVANFLCGLGGQYALLNVTEISLCYYVAYINTGMSCASIAGNGPSSSAAVRVVSSTASVITSAIRVPSSTAAAMTVTSVPVTPGGSGGGGGSSGLSGGAIAGIVIGSVVGVVVLLGLLLLLCCRGGFGRGKSAGEDAPMGTAGTGKYGEFDSSDASNIEMESTHGETSPEA